MIRSTSSAAFLCRALLAGVWAVLLAAGAGARETVDLVIENTTVIDPAGRRVLPGHSVFVDDGRIVAVEPHRARSRTARATVAGKNRFLIPGLLDMHVHLHLSRAPVDLSWTLDLLLANGVTGVRDMASDCWEPRPEGAVCADDLRRLAHSVDRGERIAPRLLSLSSAVVRGVLERGQLPDGARPYFAPETAEEGRELARYLSQRGVDLVKVYNTVPREAYFALVAEAKELGLEVSGHLPFGVSLVEASEAGHRTVEHARDLPVACSRYGAEYRDTMHRVISGDLEAEPPPIGARLVRALRGFDEELCQRVLQTLVENQTVLVPTHGTREMDARAGDDAYRQDRRLRFVAQPLRQRWDEDLEETARLAPRLAGLYTEFYELGLRLTAMAHSAGVPVLIGTDVNDTMIFPGFGLHDELERFAEAGLQPMEILRAATTVSAAYLGRSDDLGGISEGQLADLVLLRADPLEEIGNTRKIRAVVLGGEVLTRRALDAKLRRVSRAVAAQSRGQSPQR